MGRKKTEVQPYDFTDFVHTHESIVRAKYQTDGDIVNSIRGHKTIDGSLEYYVDMAVKRLDQNPTSFSLKKDCYRWVRNQVLEVVYRQNCVQERADLDAKFAEWFASREDAQEVWKKFVCKNPHDGYAVTLHDYSGATYSDSPWYKRSGAKTLTDIENAPVDYHMWESFIADYRVVQYIELARAPSYEVGDLIMLRAPYVGNHRHDPMYGQDVTIPRLGTIVEYKNELYRGGRRSNSRGNRNVNVLWMHTSDIRKIGEKYVKLECRKGRNVKVVK